MSKKGDENLVVGLDIGTSKVLAIVGEVTRPARSRSSVSDTIHRAA